LLETPNNPFFRIEDYEMQRLSITLIFAVIAVVVLALPGPAVADGDDDDEFPAALGYQSLLIGLNQVPPVASIGRGLASYLITQDTGNLVYTLEVLDVTSPISMAHIHLGRAGENGDVVANLCGAGSAPACATAGVIATGTITSSSLVGPLAGHPLGDLIAAMSSGGAYTNVHTANFPNGEIRGQVRLVAAGGDGDNQDGDGDYDDD
jgi:hypothetical protein